MTASYQKKECDLCPRCCKVDRKVRHGVCGSGNELTIAKATKHLWEEPCISGPGGSGAIFFSGCALHCVYCQNHLISGGCTGETVSPKRLAEIFFELKDDGVDNINLITGDHFIPLVADAISLALSDGFDLPFIFNCSGYEKPDTLRLLDGLIDVYLPDFKYMEKEPAEKYSNAPDYPEVAKEALEEMVRQRPCCIFDENGLIKEGVIVRHLLLPGYVTNSKKVLDYLHDAFGDAIYISIMSQYTPMPHIGDKYPELDRRVTKREYERLVDHAIALGIENAFIQDRSVARDSFIPDFTG